MILNFPYYEHYSAHNRPSQLRRLWGRQFIKFKLKLVAYNEREATEPVLASLCWLCRTTFLAGVYTAHRNRQIIFKTVDKKSQGHCNLCFSQQPLICATLILVHTHSSFCTLIDLWECDFNGRSIDPPGVYWHQAGAICTGLFLEFQESSRARRIAPSPQSLYIRRQK